MTLAFSIASHRIRVFSFALLCATLFFAVVERPRAISSGLVISQVYGGGGNAGATYTHDFVELYNRSSSALPLKGLSIQYASAAGTGNFGSTATQLTELPDVSLESGKYFLVQMASNAAVGAALPTPDLIDPTPIAMAAGAGKVALVSDATTLGCNGGSTTCTAAQLARIIDLVGYGTANFFEGAAAAGTLSSTTAAIRKSGNVDTDNNSADFEVTTPTPRGGGGIVTPPPPPPPIEKPIYELQGEQETSAFDDLNVSTKGIVTARKTNGFFIQVRDIESDGNPNTSDALFVFTSSAPNVTVGDEVQVVGRLDEFKSASAETPGTLTEITNPTVTPLSSDNDLPTALDLGTLLASPTSFSSRTEQFERYEGMLVTTTSMDVVAPSNMFGEFYAVISGNPRPFREPGIDVSEALPADAPAGVDRFDGNFERVMVDSDDFMIAPPTPPSTQGVRRPRLDLPAGTPLAPIRVLNVFGPLDYAFDNYRVVLDASAVSSGERAPEPVPDRVGTEFTIASLNLENFRDGTPNFESRKVKAARLIEDVLKTPDILGLIEVGDLEDLESLATSINLAAGTSYRAYLLDGNGVLGESFEQNIGYLVNDARVEKLNTFQMYKGDRFDFGGESDLLHDRPPLVLEARVRHTGTPVTVILNHLKSLIDVNSAAPYKSTGLTTGARNRLKRRLQAEDLADLVSSRISDNLVVLGDMNAFEFNDGLVDVIGTIEGSPAPVDDVTEASTDRWTHELTNLADALPAPDRYSYVFGGNAQVLDHVLVNQAMLGRLNRFTYARNNADFPESLEEDFTGSTRLSDHDAAVAYFDAVTDLSVTTTVSDVLAGGMWTAGISATNSLDTATDVTLSVVLPAGVSWQSTTAPAGWTCTTLGGIVSCHADSVASGASAAFEISGAVACNVGDGAALGVSALVGSATSETNTGNNVAVATATVSNSAPSITGAAPSLTELQFRANHLVPVTVSYNATDACGPVTTSLSVTSSDPVTGHGEGVAGHTSPDWIVVNNHEVMLRSERLPTSAERVYTITITAIDEAGQIATTDVTVTVPR